MPDPSPELEADIRALAEMPDDFYQMYENSGQITMINGIQFARNWVASRDKNAENESGATQEECRSSI